MDDDDFDDLPDEAFPPDDLAALFDPAWNDHAIDEPGTTGPPGAALVAAWLFEIGPGRELTARELLELVSSRPREFPFMRLALNGLAHMRPRVRGGLKNLTALTLAHRLGRPGMSSAAGRAWRLKCGRGRVTGHVLRWSIEQVKNPAR